MRLFSFSAAKHYCASFAGSSGASINGTDYFLRSFTKKTRVITEGTPEYAQVRDALLRDTDRRLFLSLASYRRAILNTNSGSAYWSCVSLYYTSFFCAQAILGMFGGWISGSGKPWIEGVENNPGNLALQILFSKHPSTLRGAHRIFWDAYYSSIQQIVPFIDAKYSNALQPINSQITWAIDTRNKINYQPIEAMSLRNLFHTQYDPANIPGCFPSDLGTFCTVAEAFMGLSRELATSLGLSTDSFSAIATTRREATLQSIVHEVRDGINGALGPMVVAYAV